MKKIKNLFNSILLYIERKETEKSVKESVNLLMQLNLSHSLIEAVEVKQKFDLEFINFLAQKKIENENNLNAINNY